MFTIKHVVRSSDTHGSPNLIRLYEATSPALELKENVAPAEAQVTFQFDGVTCSIDTGIVYVMNAQGRTVETFRLKGSEFL